MSITTIKTLLAEFVTYGSYHESKGEWTPFKVLSHLSKNNSELYIEDYALITKVINWWVEGDYIKIEGKWNTPSYHLPSADAFYLVYNPDNTFAGLIIMYKLAGTTQYMYIRVNDDVTLFDNPDDSYVPMGDLEKEFMASYNSSLKDKEKEPESIDDIVRTFSEFDTSIKVSRQDTAKFLDKHSCNIYQRVVRDTNIEYSKFVAVFLPDEQYGYNYFLLTDKEDKIRGILINKFTDEYAKAVYIMKKEGDN